MQFVADSMLGKLARWLRVMGHDVIYKRSYSLEELTSAAAAGRIVLSRNRALVKRGIPVVFISSDRSEGQLMELFGSLDIKGDPALWFSRCIECNEPLADCDDESVRFTVPEYVAARMAGKIKKCQRCGKLFWPGSHRMRMEERLRSLGF